MMTRPAETTQPRPRPMPASLRLPACACDIHAALSRVLSPDWIVQRETNPDGEMSILVMAADDETNVLPTFMLYECDGLVQVATVQDDAWQHLSGFASAQAAVAAIIAAIIPLSGILPAAL